MAAAGFKALTAKGNGRLNRIITDVRLCTAFDPAAPPNPLPTQTNSRALWDTGATSSVISPALVQALALTPVGAVRVTHAGGVGNSPTYLLNLLLPNHVGFAGILVTEFPPPADGSFSVIIGMDVICTGDFSITNLRGQTWMSFRTPSTASIDYVVEADRITFAGIGRNELCRCGSGKKYKKCHGAA